MPELLGKVLDKLIVDQVLEVIKPASLELSLAACENLQKERNRLLKDWRQRLERAQYEVDKASRHYHTVEPENRLVARELERRWEEKLIEQRKLKEDYDRYVSYQVPDFTEMDRDAIRKLASDIPALWHAPETTNQDRQAIVRILLKQAIARVENQTERVAVTLCWMGDIYTRHEILRPVRRYEQMKDYAALLERVVKLHDKGLTVSEIADRLNAEGWHPPKRCPIFKRAMVADLLSRKRPIGRRPKSTDGLLRKNEWWLDDFARAVNMPQITVYCWARRRGWIANRQLQGRQGRIVLWADLKEMARIKALREWMNHRTGWSIDPPPSHLTTPRRSPMIVSTTGGQCHEVKARKSSQPHQAAR